MTNQPEEPSKDSTRDLALQLVRATDARRRREPLQVTTGAGIAIAGAWLAGSALTITILLIVCVFNPATDAELANIDTWMAIGICFMIASPMIAAYTISKVILSKD